MIDLIEINIDDFDVFLDIRYATKNNLCNHSLYSKPFCYLHKNAAANLQKAIKIAQNHNLKLKIWDCYRPLAVQQYMFDFFSYRDDVANFISDPKNGFKTHCRGIAIDLTLTDKNGVELDMATDFDEFSKRSFHGCNSISTAAQKNRILLLNIMTQAGFNFIPNEWWHYQMFDPLDYAIIKADDYMLSDKVRISNSNNLIL